MTNDNGRVHVFIFGSNIAVSSKCKIKSCHKCLKWCSVSANILVLVKSLKNLSRKEYVHNHNKEELHNIPKHREQGNEHLWHCFLNNHEIEESAQWYGLHSYSHQINVVFLSSVTKVLPIDQSWNNEENNKAYNRLSGFKEDLKIDGYHIPVSCFIRKTSTNVKYLPKHER